MRFFPSSSSVCIILQYSTLTTPQPPPSLPSFTTSARFDRGFFLPLLSSPRGGILVFFFVSMLLLLPSRESELISVSARPLALPLEFRRRRLCRVPSWVGLSLHLILLRLGCCCFCCFCFSLPGESLTLTTKGNTLCFAYIFESSLFVSLLFGVRCDLFQSSPAWGVCCHLWAQSTLCLSLSLSLVSLSLLLVIPALVP